MKRWKLLSLFLVCILHASLAYGQLSDLDDWDDDFQDETIEVRDPYEAFNRKMFAFNQKTYDYIFEPIANGYDFLIPKKVQHKFSNLFSNARMPIRFFSSLFQGKFKGASTVMGRFVINSSVGIGGFFDPAASQFNLEFQNEDFGQMLGHHGMDAGPYYVFPLIGPTTRRDSIGFILDTAFNPLTWLGIYEVRPKEAVYGAHALSNINHYSYELRDKYNSIIDGALDPYIAIQHAFIQVREKKIKE